MAEHSKNGDSAFANTILAVLKRSLPLLVSFLFLAVVLTSAAHLINLKKTGKLLLSMDANWLVVALALTTATILVNSYRLVVISQCLLAKHPSYHQAVKITWLGSFLALSTPVAVFGDVARAGLMKWVLGSSVRNSIEVILFDRGISLYCLLLLVMVSVLGCYPYFNQSWLLFAQVIMPLALLGLLAAVFLIHYFVQWPNNRIGNYLKELLNKLAYLLKQPRYMLPQIIIAIFNIVFYVGIFWALSHAMHFSFALMNLLLFAPLIVIVNNLPFFYLGWGGREAVFLMLMPIIAPHVGSESVLAASFGYGVITMIAALFGGFYLLGVYKNKVTEPSS